MCGDECLCLSINLITLEVLGVFSPFPNYPLIVDVILRRSGDPYRRFAMALKLLVALFALAGVDAFAPGSPLLAQRSKVAASKVAPTMSMDMVPSSLEQVSTTLAGVVAVDGGTVGLDVQFGAFLAVILGLFIPVVFLITLFIQSDAQGTATTFRQPDSIGGTRFEDE